MREFKPEIVRPMKQWPVVTLTLSAIVVLLLVFKGTDAPPPPLDIDPAPTASGSYSSGETMTSTTFGDTRSSAPYGTRDNPAMNYLDNEWGVVCGMSGDYVYVVNIGEHEVELLHEASCASEARMRLHLPHGRTLRMDRGRALLLERDPVLDRLVPSRESLTRDEKRP